MKILFFSRGYGDVAGGIEKMSLDLARGLTERCHEITIISLDDENAKSFFNWPKNVNWIKLGIGDVDKKNGFLIRIKRARAIRKVAVEGNFTSALGFQVGAFALLRFALIGTGIKVIAAERNSPSLFKFIKNGKFKKFFANLILIFAHKISIQFESYKKYYSPIIVNKIFVAPNWVEINQKLIDKNYSDRYRVLFIGRLAYQKNVDVLIRSFAGLPSSFELLIVGNGPDEIKLRSLAKQVGLKNVTFKPPTHELSRLFQNTDLLCLPSRWEGFPNVIAEAFSFGIPCVGFSLCSGIQELIIDNKSGVIADGISNEVSLRNAIIKASKIRFDPQEIINTVVEYSFQNFIDIWEKILE